MNKFGSFHVLNIWLCINRSNCFILERIVCDQIFEGFDSLRDQCFGEVTGSSVLVLLSFGDAIAKSKICDKIFEGFDYLRDQCFGEVTGSNVSMLLSFGDAITKSKISIEKLFVLLDMYEIMHKLHSEV